METTNPVTKEINSKLTKKDAVGILIVFFVTLAIFASDGGEPRQGVSKMLPAINVEEVIPKESIVLPIVWGDLGKKMVESGVIDASKFEMLYSRRGELGEYERALLYSANNGQLVINQENAGVVLNLLWAFGLSNKNSILENGPMTDPRYGEAGNFASTGGWTLAMGNPMNHYSQHGFIVLTPSQQALVERVAKTIYRPCCDNATYFPDCNHGMAMLGLLELMASRGASETEMYKVALVVNSFWFPDVYQTIAQFFASQGISWTDIDPKTVLGPEYSSASGYSRILTLVKPPESTSGPGCSV
jgi:hypothetical protein